MGIDENPILKNTETSTTVEVGTQEEFWKALNARDPFDPKKTRIAFTRSVEIQGDLKEQNLTNIDFTGVSLAGKNLERANLAGADLRRVDITGANLRGANLTGANLGSQTLTGQFDGATLKNANLGNVRMSPTASFERANLSGADMRNIIADLGGESGPANFRNAKLERANLEGARLAGARFDGAELEMSNLRGTNLRFASFVDAKLGGADLTTANIGDADLSGADMDHVKLSDKTDAKKANIRGATFNPRFVEG